jgi:zinc protease
VAADPNARLAAKTISFDELAPIGEPGTIVAQKPLGVLGIENIFFANGSRALLWSNKAEPGRVSVRMRFGAGYRAFEQDEAAYIALGRSALVGSGQGDLGQEELDRITTGRVMGFNVDITDSTFAFAAQTRGADLADQLSLFANKLSDPRWDPNPVIRAKAAQQLSYAGMATSPGGVLQRDLEFFVNDRDGRFKTADPADLEAATPEGFREVWGPILEQGDIEVVIFGDFDQAATVETLRRTIGALPPRKVVPVNELVRVPQFPSADSEAIIRTHRGDANQAAAIVAWPTGGGVAGLPESRQLEILVSVFNNRLIEAMRERAGASYSPQVVSNWPVDLASGGRITALAQLKPDDVPAFFAAADQIAYDLATTPATADELARATEPLKQTITRASTGNLFWLYQIEGSSADPRRLYSLNTLRSDYSETTPARMQALAQRYLVSRPGWQMAIIPEGAEIPKISRTVPIVSPPTLQVVGPPASTGR